MLLTNGYKNEDDDYIITSVVTGVILDNTFIAVYHEQVGTGNIYTLWNINNISDSNRISLSQIKRQAICSDLDPNDKWIPLQSGIK